MAACAAGKRQEGSDEHLGAVHGSWEVEGGNLNLHTDKGVPAASAGTSSEPADKAQVKHKYA